MRSRTRTLWPMARPTPPPPPGGGRSTVALVRVSPEAHAPAVSAAIMMMVSPLRAPQSPTSAARTQARIARVQKHRQRTASGAIVAAVVAAAWGRAPRSRWCRRPGEAHHTSAATPARAHRAAHALAVTCSSPRATSAAVRCARPLLRQRSRPGWSRPPSARARRPRQAGNASCRPSVRPTLASVSHALLPVSAPRAPPPTSGAAQAG